jgi:hypothetical protein
MTSESARDMFITGLTEIESGENGWIKYYDEPTRRMFYRYNDGDPIMDMVTDCIVDYPMSKVICS